MAVAGDVSLDRARADSGVGRSGRVAVGRGRVGEIQRVRIMGAMAELVRERGAAGVTVAHVVARSGVSRRTFYELFEDREDCLQAAFDHAVSSASAAVLPAYRSARREEERGVWESGVRAGLAALLEFFDREPAIGGLCVIDGLAAGPAVLERRARVVAVLVDVVHGAARSSLGSRRQGRIVAEGVVGAVLAVIHARMLEAGAKPLPSLLNPLMGIIVLPYLGPDAAKREQTQPVRRRRAPAQRPGDDPLRNLDMRLTYRTVRVLLAIAELGGQESSPSSREVADAAGVTDQGQISKLLWRLEHLGLIANHAVGHGKGEPNAWSLTAKGEQIEQAIRSQTQSLGS